MNKHEYQAQLRRLTTQEAELNDQHRAKLAAYKNHVADNMAQANVDAANAVGEVKKIYDKDARGINLAYDQEIMAATHRRDSCLKQAREKLVVVQRAQEDALVAKKTQLEGEAEAMLDAAQKNFNTKIAEIIEARKILKLTFDDSMKHAGKPQVSTPAVPPKPEVPAESKIA